MLMYSIFAILGIVGMLAASLIPETFKQPLPECVEDIENIPHHPYLSWRVWKHVEDESPPPKSIGVDTAGEMVKTPNHNEIR